MDDLNINHRGKNVSIFIKSAHNTEDSNPDKVSFFTDGTYMHRGNISSVVYEESDVSGLPGTRTVLTISPRGVSLSRRGTINSHMSFQKGQHEHCPMNTPYGSVMVGIDTLELNHSFDEDGGKLRMDYAMDFEHRHFGKHTFEMEVKPNNC